MIPNWIWCSHILVCLTSIGIVVTCIAGLWLNVSFLVKKPDTPLKLYLIYKSILKIFVATLYMGFMVDAYFIDLPYIIDGFLPQAIMRSVVFILCLTMLLDSWLRPYDKL